MLHASLVRIAVIVSLLAGTASADPPVTRSIKVVGRAAGTDLRAKDEALMDAKREAVARACGEFLQANAFVENYELISDRIRTEGLGYITGYEKLREWEADGLTHCEISATVEAARLGRDWQAFFDQLREDIGNPRTTILITQDHDVADGVPPTLDGAVQRQFERYFLDHRMDVRNEGISERVRERDVNLAQLNNEIAKLAAMAAEFKADLLVLGEARADSLGPHVLAGTTLYRWNMTLNVTVVQADAARTLVSDSIALPAPYMSTGQRCDEKAFNELAKAAAPKVLKMVADAWRVRATSFREFELRIDGCPRKKLVDEVLPRLREIRGAGRDETGIRLREFVNNVGTIDVRWQFDIMHLAETVEKLNVPGLTLTVEEQTENRLGIRAIESE